MTPFAAKNGRTKLRLLLIPCLVENGLVTQRCWRPIGGKPHQPHNLPGHAPWMSLRGKFNVPPEQDLWALAESLQVFLAVTVSLKVRLKHMMFD
jgi:hypothetical protein